MFMLVLMMMTMKTTTTTKIATLLVHPFSDLR
jgi:hypothetical protein